MKMYILFFFLNILNIVSSCQHSTNSKIEILPLHPFSLSPSYYDSTIKVRNSFIAKYYFIREASDATDELSILVDQFLDSTLNKDSSDFTKYGSYYVYFYKESRDINEKFRQRVDGVFPNTLEQHKSDLLYQYQWSHKKFVECDFYKNEVIYKRVYTKKGKLFEPSLPPSVMENLNKKKILIKKVSPNK